MKKFQSRFQETLVLKNKKGNISMNILYWIKNQIGFAFLVLICCANSALAQQTDIETSSVLKPQIITSWNIDDPNPPSCTIIKARIAERGLTLTEIENARDRLTQIIQGDHPNDVVEIFRRYNIPLQLNMNTTFKVDLIYPVGVQPARPINTWEINSNLINWQTPMASAQDPPQFLRVYISPTDRIAHIEMDMPLLQVCLANNFIRFKLQTNLGEVLSVLDIPKI